VADIREASGGELPDALRAAVADNERLNKQLHVLHGNATQLRQAIADARSLHMHLQQETADASGSCSHLDACLLRLLARPCWSLEFTIAPPGSLQRHKQNTSVSLSQHVMYGVLQGF
jgi:hypothetical protein